MNNSISKSISRHQNKVAKFAPKPVLKQVGIIKYGAGINATAWINKARKDGYTVKLNKGYAALMR